MFGSHLLRAWSKTQATIALSSGESETLAAIRGGTEALGMLSLMRDLGVEMTSTLRLDASAALGILQRKGVGKIRHLDVGCLWLQEKEAREQIKLAKEPGETNPADIGTKHLSEEVMLRHLRKMSCEFRDGRPDSSSKILNSLDGINQGASRADACDVGRARPRVLKAGKAPCGVWVREAEGRWMRKDKSARALRGFQGCAEVGNDLGSVVAYTVEDNCSGRVIANIGVKGKSIEHPEFVAKLNRPVDIISRIICRQPCASTDLINKQEKKPLFVGSCVQARTATANAEDAKGSCTHPVAVGRISNFEVSELDMLSSVSGIEEVVDLMGESNAHREPRTHGNDNAGKAVWGNRCCRARFCRGLHSDNFGKSYVHEARIDCVAELSYSRCDSVSHSRGSNRACTCIDSMHMHTYDLTNSEPVAVWLKLCECTVPCIL